MLQLSGKVRGNELKDPRFTPQPWQKNI
jgi:hypothetical protein